ncbi:YcnI family protein [Parvibaculum sp.]|uniref:YcnI family copper-binding membrane protein n=1 Tax=Parvibaculum sp. TaxID=2024848 RepID=UPI00391BDEB4
MKHLLAAIGAAAIFAAAALPASAHVVLDQEQAPAGSYFKATFRVPHGCDGSPTTSISIAVPEGVISVKPQPKHGWTVTTEKAPYKQSYTLHGKTITEGVVRVTWEGGPLADDMFDEFAFMTKLPDDPEIMMLFFPVIQTCEEGSVAWDQLPVPGSAERLPRPAPMLHLDHGTGDGGHHHH